MPLGTTELQVVVAVAAVAVGGGGGGWLGGGNEVDDNDLQNQVTTWSNNVVLTHECEAVPDQSGGLDGCKCSLSRSRYICCPLRTTSSLFRHLPTLDLYPSLTSILHFLLWTHAHTTLPRIHDHAPPEVDAHFSCRSFCLPLFWHWISPFHIEHYQVMQDAANNSSAFSITPNARLSM